MKLRGHRLHPLARAKLRLGIKPWLRCPGGDHRWRRVYGDERMFTHHDLVCDDCLAEADLQ